MCRVIVSEQDNWKNGIKKYGRQFNDILDVYQDGESSAGSFQDVILGTFTQGDINKVQYSCDTSLFKSDMGKLVVDINKSSSNFNLLEKGKLLRYRQQLLNDDGSVLATADYKFFIITEIEEQKDKKSVLVTCYDHLIKAMQDYIVPKKRSTDRTFQDNKLYFQLTNGKYVKYTGARTGDPFVLNLYEDNLTYPITISNYLSKIMAWLYLGYTTSHIIQGNGINWGPKNTNLEIEKEHYLDSDSNSLGYTFRDVLDDIAECMGGRIQMQYDLVNGYWNKNFSISGVVRDYGIMFNEEMLNDKNVNMGELYTPNVIVLSRANDSDNIYYPATLPQNPVEVKISDNPILEQDNRGDFIQGIYENINGLSFHINDLATKGISANEIGDLYSVVIDNISYPCLMLSDDMIRSTGLKENIKTPEPKQSVTDYKYASYSDKVAITSKNAKILVDKANASIEQIVEAVGDNGEVTTASIVQSINDSGSQIKLNADKVYINGVTFDENQNMTMTDGTIALEDNPETEVIPSISITTSNDNNSKIGLWSKKINSTERYGDYTTSNRYVEGYGLSHYTTSNDKHCILQIGRATEVFTASASLGTIKEGIIIEHRRSHSGNDYTTSMEHSHIEIWDKNNTTQPVSYITEKDARLKDTFIDGILQAYLGFALWNGDFKVGYNGSKIYANTYDDSPVVVNNIRTKNMFDQSIIVQGDITGVGTTRLNSRQVLYLSEGTYTFSCPNIASPYEWGLQIQNIGVPPLSAWPTLIYETGWINSSTTSRTFTLTTSGWFTLMLRKSNNSTITPSEVTNINFQLEKGSEATTYSPYQDLNNQEIYTTGEQKIGTWIDGKPLYRKVVNYAPTSVIGVAGQLTDINIPHGISNFRRAIKCIGTKGYTNYILPVIGGSNATSATLVKQVDATNIIFRIINDTWSPDTWSFIIEYTKTTD